MLFGVIEGKSVLHYLEGALGDGETVLPSLALGEISSKLLKDTVSNYLGGNFSESGGYTPCQNPFAEAVAKSLLASITSEGYIQCNEASATRVLLNLVNVLDHNADSEAGLEVTYGQGDTSLFKS